MLRNSIDVDTPEGTALRLAPAGLVPRALAWSIDFALRMLVYFILVSVFGSLMVGLLFDAGSTDSVAYGMGVGSIVFFLLEWFFTAVPEALFGTTPGKKWLGLRVVHVDGTPLGWQAAVLRNFLRFADFLPMFYFFGSASMLIDPRSRRLGDLAAGSMVVYHQFRKAPVAEATSGESLAPALVLSLEERAVLLDFDERCEGLTPARQQELAAQLSALSLGEGEEAVRRLRGWANWIRRGGAA